MIRLSARLWQRHSPIKSKQHGSPLRPRAPRGPGTLRGLRACAPPSQRRIGAPSCLWTDRHRPCPLSSLLRPRRTGACARPRLRQQIRRSPPRRRHRSLRADRSTRSLSGPSPRRARRPALRKPLPPPRDSGDSRRRSMEDLLRPHAATRHRPHRVCLHAPLRPRLLRRARAPPARR